MKKALNIFIKKMEEKAISYAFDGEIYRRKSQFKLALRFFNKAIFLNPKSADFYMLRALVKLELVNHKGALADINKAISINKFYNWYHIYKYVIQKRMGRQEQGKKDLLLVEENEDNNLDSLFDYLADIELKDNNVRDAIYFLEKALSKNSKNEKLLIKKINLQRSVGEYEKAYLDADCLIGLNVSHPEYYHVKSTVCFDMKKFDEALTQSNKAIELCQTNHGYYAHRARIENELEKYNEGLKDIDVSLTMDCNNVFYMELKNQFLEKLGLVEGHNNEKNM